LTVKRNQEFDDTLNRPPVDDQADADMAAAQDSGFRRATETSRSRPGAESGRVPMAPLPPFRVQPSLLNRNPPSHPAWEKPLTPYHYPTIRGQEKRQTMKPLIFVAIGVVLILGVVLAFPALTRKSSPAPVPSDSSSPIATVLSQPSRTAAPTQSAAAGSPAPFVSFQQYKVLAGDSIGKIATKFHLQRWELLQANPQITGPAYAVRINSFINIPQPGQLIQATPGPTGLPTGSPGAQASATVAAP
jgi:LysM repeat protein